MKSFLAGLSLGIAAAVAYSRWPSRANKQREAEGSSAPERNPGIGAAAGRPPVRSAREAVLTSAASAGAPKPEPATLEPARSSEEVLNSATRQQLLSVYGIGPVLADRILRNRPYASAHDLVEQGIIPESIFVQLRKQLLEPGAMPSGPAPKGAPSSQAEPAQSSGPV